MANISQTKIDRIIRYFLLSMGERLPEWTRDGLCNAFDVLAMRAAMAGKEDQFYDRLERLSAKVADENYNAISEMGYKLKLYREERNRLVSIALAKQKAERNSNAPLKKEQIDQIHRTVLANLAMDEAQVKLLHEAEDFYVFINSLLFVQSPGRHYAFRVRDKIVTQFDFESQVALLPPDEKQRTPSKQVYSFAFNFQGQAQSKGSELTEVLSQILRADGFARIGTTDHTMHITTHVDATGARRFKLYDANNLCRPNLLSLEELVNEIKKGLFTDFGDPVDYLPIAIRIFGVEDKSRPTPLALCESILERRRSYNQGAGIPFDSAEALGLNKKGFDGVAALFAASAVGNDTVVNRLLEYNDLAIDARNRDGLTALDIAVMHGQVAVVKTLTDKKWGARKQKLQPIHLFYACETGNVELVKLVLATLKEDKVDWNRVCDTENNSVLMIAVSRHLYEVVKVLIAAKPNLSHKNDKGETAQAIAAANKDSEMIALLKTAVKEKEEPFGLNEIHHFVYEDWADVDKHIDKKVVAKAREAQVNARVDRIRSMFAKHIADPVLRQTIKAIGNAPLEKILFGAQPPADEKAAEQVDIVSPSDGLINYYLDALEIQHGLLADKDKGLSEESRALYKKVFKACQFFCAIIEKENIPPRVKEADLFAVFEYAYKLVVLFGNDPDKIFVNIDAYLKFHHTKAVKPLHDALMDAFPTNKANQIHLNHWRTLIIEHGKKALKYFSQAAEIEKILGDQSRPKIKGGRAPNTLNDVLRAVSAMQYKRAKEDPALAQVSIKHNLSKELFERALELNKKRKMEDNLPALSLHGKTVDPRYKKYHLIKLPINDPHAYVLGHETNCCQSIGRQAEACVIDGVTRPNNGFYALLKEKALPGKDAKAGERAPLVNGAIDYNAFEIVGQSYAWLSADGNLVFDSWENLTPLQEDKVAVPMLTEFAKQVCASPESPIVRVTIGLGGKTPAEFKSAEVATYASETPKEGTHFSDSRRQANVYINENKLALMFADVDKLVDKCYDANDKPPFIPKPVLLNWIKSGCYSVEKAKKITAKLTPEIIQFLKTQPAVLTTVPFNTLLPLRNAILADNKILTLILSYPWHSQQICQAFTKLIDAGIPVTDAIQKKVADLLAQGGLFPIVDNLLLLHAAKIPIDAEILSSPFVDPYVSLQDVKAGVANLAFLEQSEWKAMLGLRSLILFSRLLFVPMEDLKIIISAIIKIKALQLPGEIQIINHVMMECCRDRSTWIHSSLNNIVAKCTYLKESPLHDNPFCNAFLCKSFESSVSEAEFKKHLACFASFRASSNLSDESIDKIVFSEAYLSEMKMSNILKVCALLKGAKIPSDDFLQILLDNYFDKPEELATNIITAVTLFEKKNLVRFPAAAASLYKNKPQVVIIQFRVISELDEVGLINDRIVAQMTELRYANDKMIDSLSVMLDFLKKFPNKERKEAVQSCLTQGVFHLDIKIEIVVDVINGLTKANLEQDSDFFVLALKILSTSPWHLNEKLEALIKLWRAELPDEANVIDKIMKDTYNLVQIINNALAAKSISSMIRGIEADVPRSAEDNDWDDARPRSTTSDDEDAAHPRSTTSDDKDDAHPKDPADVDEARPLPRDPAFVDEDDVLPRDADDDRHDAILSALFENNNFDLDVLSDADDQEDRSKDEPILKLSLNPEDFDNGRRSPNQAQGLDSKEKDRKPALNSQGVMKVTRDNLVSHILRSSSPIPFTPDFYLMDAILDIPAEKPNPIHSHLEALGLLATPKHQPDAFFKNTNTPANRPPKNRFF